MSRFDILNSRSPSALSHSSAGENDEPLVHLDGVEFLRADLGEYPHDHDMGYVFAVHGRDNLEEKRARQKLVLIYKHTKAQDQRKDWNASRQLNRDGWAVLNEFLLDEVDLDGWTLVTSPVYLRQEEKPVIAFRALVVPREPEEDANGTTTGKFARPREDLADFVSEPNAIKSQLVVVSVPWEPPPEPPPLSAPSDLQIR